MKLSRTIFEETIGKVLPVGKKEKSEPTKDEKSWVQGTLDSILPEKKEEKPETKTNEKGWVQDKIEKMYPEKKDDKTKPLEGKENEKDFPRF